MIYAHIPVSPLSLFSRRVSKFRTEILIFIVICMYMVTEILQNFPLQHRPHNRLLASIQSERTNFFPDMTIATPFRLALSETVQWFGSDLITGYLKWGTRRAGNIHTMFRKSVDVIVISVLGFHGATAITSMRISFDRSWKFGLRIDHILSPWSRLTTPGLHIYRIFHIAYELDLSRAVFLIPLCSYCIFIACTSGLEIICVLRINSSTVKSLGDKIHLGNLKKNRKYEKKWSKN